MASVSGAAAARSPATDTLLPLVIIGPDADTPERVRARHHNVELPVASGGQPRAERNPRPLAAGQAPDPSRLLGQGAVC